MLINLLVSGSDYVVFSVYFNFNVFCIVNVLHNYLLKHMALISGLTRLIEKELKGEHNPVACAEEVIYNGNILYNSITEIIIPRIGDLIQEIVIKSDELNKNELPNISSTYIETVNEYVKLKNQYPLQIFKTNTGLRLLCDYEVNLLRPYQVTNLVLVTDNSKSDLNGHKQSVSIIANYIFVDTNSRRKLFF